MLGLQMIKTIFKPHEVIYVPLNCHHLIIREILKLKFDLFYYFIKFPSV